LALCDTQASRDFVLWIVESAENPLSSLYAILISRITQKLTENSRQKEILYMPGCRSNQKTFFDEVVDKCLPKNHILKINDIVKGKGIYGRHGDELKKRAWNIIKVKSGNLPSSKLALSTGD